MSKATKKALKRKIDGRLARLKTYPNRMGSQKLCSRFDFAKNENNRKPSRKRRYPSQHPSSTSNEVPDVPRSNRRMFGVQMPAVWPTGTFPQQPRFTGSCEVPDAQPGNPSLMQSMAMMYGHPDIHFMYPPPGSCRQSDMRPNHNFKDIRNQASP